FGLEPDGTLCNVFNVEDDATLQLQSTTAVTTANVGGTTYLFAAGVLEGVSVFEVGNDGSLTNVANVPDSTVPEMGGPVALATADVGGTNYLFVAGEFANGLSVFAIGNDGSLT